MSKPDSNNSDRQPRRESEDSSSRTTRPFDNDLSSLFNTLWSLPVAIYQRGNEHGREFSRLLDEQRKERVEEQERADGKEHRGCGRRGRRHWENHRRREEQEQDVAHQTIAGSDANNKSEQDRDHEWINQIAKTLAMNEREAQNLYTEQRRMMENEQERRAGGDDIEQKLVEAADQWMKSLPRPTNYDEAAQQFHYPGKASTTVQDVRLCRKDKPTHPRPDMVTQKGEQSQSKWAEIFPAWSNQTAAVPDQTQKRSNEQNAKISDSHSEPGGINKQQIEDAFNKMHDEIKDMMAGASQLSKMFQDGYRRESRLFDEEGLFGPSFPFNRPLSTIFSLGVRPFLPQDSAMSYLLFSEYSPLHLEHEEGFDASFRRRFEDLIMVQSGRDMRSDDGAEDRKLDFVTRIMSLLKTDDGRVTADRVAFSSDGGVHADMHLEFGKHTSAPTQDSAQGDAHDAPKTEQDLYEQHFPLRSGHGRCCQCGMRFADTAALSDHQCAGQTLVQHHPASPLSGVLSTLTTTERHTDVDGTVTTKTVLKRRFADGREETESSTHTENSPAAWARQRQLEASTRHQERGNTYDKEARKGSGWFWSNK